MEGRKTPNLARAMTPAAINHLWVAAVLLDAFSRKVIGWASGRTLEAELALAALRMALAERRPSAGLVRLRQNGSAPPGSRSRPGHSGR